MDDLANWQRQNRYGYPEYLRFKFALLVLWLVKYSPINTLRPTQNGRHFVDDFFKDIFLNENFGIPNNISLNYVPQGLVDNTSSLGSDNGLVPNRWRAIIWTDDGLVY